MAKDNKIWRARKGLAFRKLVDGGMLFDQKGQQVHHFNETAAVVWELCARGQTTAEIVARLRSAYKVDETQIVADVQEVLKDFSGSDLLQ